ncbi:MAG: hypothetical protein QXN08_08880 [Nitrososphaerales archaeon]
MSERIMSKRKTIKVSRDVYERLIKLRDVLGERSVESVIEKALDALEKELDRREEEILEYARKIFRGESE